MIWLACVVLPAAATAASPTTFSKRIAVAPTDRIQMSNLAGSVTITAWDKAEVDVQANLGAGVERVDVSQRQGTISISVIVSSRGRDAGAALRVNVPAASALEISTVSASIAVEGGSGRMRLKSVSGGIRADVQSGNLEVESVSGSIDLRGSGKPDSRMRASSVSGGVKLSNAGGDVEVRTTSGSVSVAGDAASTEITTVSGSTSFHGKLLRDAELQVETVSGSVVVAAAADAGYRYEVTTFSGSISNCFGAELRREGRGPGRHLDGTRGDALATVQVKSFSGSVQLCDR
jgi:DUF4097 and DUF4098 domain-containing protein YvlB